jgi:hypothetical protein
MSLISTIGKLVVRFMNKRSGWKKSHVNYCDDKGYEEVWRNKNGFAIIHCVNAYTSSFMSVHAPAHVWKIGGGLDGESWSLTFMYGKALFKGEVSGRTR